MTECPNIRRLIVQSAKGEEGREGEGGGEGGEGGREALGEEMGTRLKRRGGERW
jgi:hypothetical protein